MPNSKERKPAAEASEPKRKTFSSHVGFFVHAFIQGHLTLPARGESQPSVSLC